MALIYPNGSADVGHFHAAGGFSFLGRQLLDAGLMHGDARTVRDAPLSGCLQTPDFADGSRLQCWPPSLVVATPARRA